MVSWDVAQIEATITPLILNSRTFNQSVQEKTILSSSLTVKFLDAVTIHPSKLEASMMLTRTRNTSLSPSSNFSLI